VAENWFIAFRGEQSHRTTAPGETILAMAQTVGGQRNVKKPRRGERTFRSQIPGYPVLTYIRQLL